MDYTKHFVRDPKICGGDPVIRGTRVTMRTVLASLAAGDRPRVLLKQFPTLAEDDIWAAIACAAELARENRV